MATGGGVADDPTAAGGIVAFVGARHRAQRCGTRGGGSRRATCACSMRGLLLFFPSASGIPPLFRLCPLLPFRLELPGYLAYLHRCVLVKNNYWRSTLML